MDEKKEIMLREWEQRYECYRSYTRNYLTYISLAITGYAIGMSLILSLDMIPLLRAGFLIIVLVFLSVVLWAHRITIKEFTRLGERLDKLESKLGIEKFDTARPLKTAARVSAWGTGIITLGTLGLAINFLVLAITGG